MVEKFEIPAKDIIIEDQSDATHGNLAYGLREMYKEHVPVGKFAMLSSEYHLPRAKKMAEESGIRADLIPAEEELLESNPLYKKYMDNWLSRAKQQPLEDNEAAKLNDHEYWADRAAVFSTPLDQPAPPVDISKSVAETAKRLSEAGADGVQTSSF